LMIRTVHRGDPDRHPSTVLNARLVREFERMRISEAEKLATAETRALILQRVRTSTASYLRQARSVVAAAKIKFYEGMKLPDLSGFRAERVETPQRSLPRPLDMKALAAMEKATPNLAIEDPAVYVSHLLFSRLGLRNVEIVNAR